MVIYGKRILTVRESNGKRIPIYYHSPTDPLSFILVFISQDIIGRR